MKHSLTTTLAGLATLSLATAVGCGGAMQTAATPPPPPGSMSTSAGYASGGGAGGDYAGGASAAPMATSRSEAYGGAVPGGAEPAPQSRPGLATEWGESRDQPLAFQPFYRAAPQSPFATTAIRYNDAQGAAAQAYARGGAGAVQYIGAYHGGVHVSLRDENGAPLPGQIVGDTLYVVGQHGQRYTIVLENRTPGRYEAVVSVDGLDVMNGQQASFAHRGYILNPHDTLRIEGFRQSNQSVAAFRFGTVADSYAAQTGTARNVGVIGVALFHEQGYVLQPYHDEIQMRETANPFPGQGFAPPPPVRRYY